MSWTAMPLDLKLTEEHVEVIGCGTNGGAKELGLEGFYGLLNSEEKARVDRLRIAEKRREALVARGMARAVLGRLLGVEARALVFEVGTHGKPSCVECGAAGICFNLSHTRGRALLAVGLRCEVGVDVELAWKGQRVMELAERYFSLAEREGLRGLAVGEQVAGFYRVWTRKEAIIKATGRGIGMGLDTFSVPVDEMREAAEVRVPGSGWVLQNVEMAWPLVGAVATEFGRVVRRWEFSAGMAGG